MNDTDTVEIAHLQSRGLSIHEAVALLVARQDADRERQELLLDLDPDDWSAMLVREARARLYAAHPFFFVDSELIDSAF